MEVTIFPEKEWVTKPASELGFSEDELKAVPRWFERNAGDRNYRMVLVRDGYIAGEWQRGIDADRQFGLASAAKSVYSSVLGIVVEEGKLPSADAKVIDYYPEMMDIKEGEGPKPGRFAKPEDRDITFRQLISNMSGYMKPGESPDSTFHYQTFGMNIITHALAKIYGYYDSEDPERLPGFGRLVTEKIRDSIGGRWSYKYNNFQHPEGAKIGIFGNYTSIEANARDMARIGYLWLNWGNWAGKQIIPEKWLREATKTAPNIKANCPEEQWKYGYAFWTNDHGKLWPDLPRDSYAASGAGQKHIWVCPSLKVVVTQSPGIWSSQADDCNTELLTMIAEAC
jgi:CubicO group peptidase (beta-lactamase class C family)